MTNATRSRPRAPARDRSRAPARPTGAIILAEEGIRIPAGVTDLETFRRWARSDEFPERGKITYLAGEVEIDMSPEEGNTHGSPKAAIANAIGLEVDARDLGVIYIDKMRLSNREAGLSAEPDVLVLLWPTIEAGRVRKVAKARGKKDRFVELEGTADIVVECVSDSSVGKDTKRLRELYHLARVREYWLADAREEPVRFALLRWTARRYVETRADAFGFVRSRALDRSVRLVAQPPRAGFVRWHLEVR